MIESLYIDGTQIHETAGFSVVSMKLGKPAPRESVSDVSLGHGVTDRSRYYNPRSIEVIGEVWGTDFADFWTNYDALIDAIALYDGTVIMKFRREGLAYDERATVRVNSELDLVLENPAPFARWGISLLAPDPRIYKDTSTTGSYDPVAESELTVTNGGNFWTPVTFTIDGPVTNPVITNTTTGEAMTFVGTLSSGSNITVNTGARTVRVDGSSNPGVIDAASTEWIELARGANAITLTGSGMSSGTTALSATFRDARMG